MERVVGEWTGVRGSWGNRNVFTAVPQVGQDLISLTGFPYPRPLRIDVETPGAVTTAVFDFVATVGLGPALTIDIPVPYNRSTGRGFLVVYGSSLRVSCVTSAGVLGAAERTVRAWCTPCDDAGLALARPWPFTRAAELATGTFPISFPQSNVAVAILAPVEERRRLNIVNYTNGGAGNLLLKYGAVVTLADFDHIVAPDTNHTDEAYDGFITGIWDAAGAGAAKVARFRI